MNALEKRLKRNIRLVGYGKRRNEALRKSFLNSNEDALLLDSARTASSKAIRSSKALGITIKVIRGNKIIAISPDDSEKVVRVIPPRKIDVSSLRKGMILERK